MLTITRRKDQNIRIGDDTLLKVLRAGKGSVDFEIVKDGKSQVYLDRKEDCRLGLGGKNTVLVVGVRSNTVRFGFDTVMPILREELLQQQIGA